MTVSRSQPVFSAHEEVDEQTLATLRVIERATHEAIERVGPGADTAFARAFFEALWDRIDTAA